MKLLHLDIETTPAVVYTWALYNQNISVDQIITPTSLLCFSAKWHGETEMVYRRSQKQAGPEFKSMVRKAHELLCEADAVCHYNGTTFDMPRLNQEFLQLGLPPPPPIPQVDLKKVVMTKFSMVSSKLAFIGPYLKIGEKVKHSGWDLWKGCLEGDKEQWRLMEQYNRQDVLLLEKLYTRLLPWIDGHPNMNLFVPGDAAVCVNCGSRKLHRRGLKRTATMVYRQLQCQSCGKYCRERLRDKTEPVVSVR